MRLAGGEPGNRPGARLVYDRGVTEGRYSVPLPAEVTGPYEVYLNGVRQREGVDFTVEGRTLRFVKPIAKEGRLGALRWTSMFLGVAGTYRKNDSVDVVYQVGGCRAVATGLPILPPGDETAEDASASA
jgi:hypothetical protein